MKTGSLFAIAAATAAVLGACEPQAMTDWVDEKRYGSCMVRSQLPESVPAAKARHMLLCWNPAVMGFNRSGIVVGCYEAPDWAKRSRGRPVWAGFMVPLEEFPELARISVEYRFDGWPNLERERWEWANAGEGILYAATNIIVPVDEILEGIEERRTVTYAVGGERREVEFGPKAHLALADWKYRCRVTFQR